MLAEIHPAPANAGSLEAEVTAGLERRAGLDETEQRSRCAADNQPMPTHPRRGRPQGRRRVHVLRSAKAHSHTGRRACSLGWQRSHHAAAMCVGTRCSLRTQAATRRLAATPARRRLQVSTGRTSPVSQVANLGFRGIVDRRTLWPDRPTALLWRGCGVVDVLAGGPIRRDLQAHRATARVAEQPPASTPASLPERTRRST